MVDRCSKCGNEPPSWAHGRCPVCRNSRPLSDIALRKLHRPTASPQHQPKGDSLPEGLGRRPKPTLKRQRRPSVSRPLSRSADQMKISGGIWKNSDRTVTLDFQKGTYHQRISISHSALPLSVLTYSEIEILLRIGRHDVRAWLDGDGSLVLKRITEMRFQCWLDGKLRKMCPKCRVLSPRNNTSCNACGHRFFRRRRDY